MWVGAPDQSFRTRDHFTRLVYGAKETKTQVFIKVDDRFILNKSRGPFERRAGQRGTSEYRPSDQETRTQIKSAPLEPVSNTSPQIQFLRLGFNVIVI
jgi:hypothetical protein